MGGRGYSGLLLPRGYRYTCLLPPRGYTCLLPPGTLHRHQSYTNVTLYHPPLYVDPPSMDLGQFEISKGPCWRGGLDLGLFEISKGPCWRGGVGPWTF